MSTNLFPPPHPLDLRDEAEAQLAQGPADGAAARSTDGLLHELRVHQIELEMQNESLRKMQVALEESRDRYLDLYDFAPVGYLTLSDAGLIVEANLTGATLLGVDRKKLMRCRFGAFVAEVDKERWNHLFIRVLRRAARSQIDLTLQRSDGGVWQAHIDCLHVVTGAALPTVRITLGDITERTKLECDLVASNRRIKELSLKMVNVQEEARRTLCAELHDRTSPNLAAIKINLELLSALPTGQDRGRTERLQDTMALIADTDASIREIAADLRPPLLDHTGLAPALAGYAVQFAKRTGISVHVDCEPVDTRADPVIESLLFRIFQEALTNCAKHARATSISIALDCASCPTILTVEDNGVGFDPAALRTIEHGGGLGLLTMRELAELAGGRFIIESQPGKGAHLRVEL